jgi:hypothetical protein
MPGTVDSCVSPGGFGYVNSIKQIDKKASKNNTFVLFQNITFVLKPVALQKKSILQNTISFSPFTVRGGKLMESPRRTHDKSVEAICIASAVRRRAGGMTAFEEPPEGVTTVLA